MKIAKNNRWLRFGAAATASVVLAGTLFGCGTGNDAGAGAGGTSQADIDAAVQKETTLTWWTWSDGNQPIADAFMKKYPKIKIDMVKLENPDAVVTKLQNAVKAGKGAPDIVPVEYQTLPQLTMGKALADMTPYGIDKYKDNFTASTWNAVNVGGKLVGLPLDSGPMVMIYNKDLFAKSGVTEAPKTWDDFAAASKKIHAADPEAYIANSGDAGFFTSMMWASGGQPFKSDGEKITINVQDAGSKKFASYWNTLLNASELSPVPTWSDEWTKALTQDKLGSLLIGSWMISGMKDYGLGKWQVAPMPSWDGKGATAENGGSSLAVTEQSTNKAVGAALLQFAAEGEGRDVINANGFPSNTAAMDDPTWLNMTFPAYAGDQKANQVGAAAAKAVVPGWQYLPYQGYANNVFADSVGKALGNKGDLNAALIDWQKTLVDYGNTQGFTVNK
ncbi:sugar ABC transporter substrate-binding protein [Arthrobacter sp. GMC3]|uniref:ABC transporter substrate-binding protein n=1 Tax=Arthrobacter sp. GMC3 TaxID=2058894 RepID=UPI000CE37DA0|nr:sugar ABC transporter substrate-binding protein [Arthrobacter sp. GMC3]